jgi:hypothetical protein
MPRRFYVFNDPDSVREHISQIKSVEDLYQLDYDISASGCNLVSLQRGMFGIWGLYYEDELGVVRTHLFIPTSFKWVPDKEDCDSYTILEK